jgi:hypothetical protein
MHGADWTGEKVLDGLIIEACDPLEPIDFDGLRPSIDVTDPVFASSQLPSSFDRKTPRKGLSLPVSSQKTPEISPLFKCDTIIEACDPLEPIDWNATCRRRLRPRLDGVFVLLPGHFPEPPTTSPKAVVQMRQRNAGFLKA